MTDRELLESAAKAAGFDIGHRWNTERLLLDPPVIALCIPGISTGWNPLANDGDSLRLAVRLHIGVQSNGVDHWQYPSTTIVIFDAECPCRISQLHDGDDAAATRRAIVRAAAEIGKERK